MGCGRASAAARPRSRAATTAQSRLLNSPQAISRPHPPIMIGGGGERKTLRLVAQYADATNVFGGAEMIHHKYEVIREHCAAIGRDPEEIERSTLQSVRLAVGDTPGDSVAQVVDRFGELSDAGAQHVIFSVRDVANPRVMEIVARDRRIRPPAARAATALEWRAEPCRRIPPRSIRPSCYSDVRTRATTGTTIPR